MEALECTGSCLCGAVALSGVFGESVGACHCDICRAWGGGPLLALDGGVDLRVSDPSSVTVFGSTDWAERGFCSKCGTHLYIRVKDSGRYIVPAGLFALDNELNFDHQIFIDKRPSYYCFANETRNMTGEEVFAQFTSGDAEH
jgi:hypothetical protein